MFFLEKKVDSQNINHYKNLYSQYSKYYLDFINIYIMRFVI